MNNTTTVTNKNKHIKIAYDSDSDKEEDDKKKSTEESVHWSFTSEDIRKTVETWCLNANNPGDERYKKDTIHWPHNFSKWDRSKQMVYENKCRTNTRHSEKLKFYYHPVSTSSASTK